MRIRHLVRSLLTYVPGMDKIISKLRGTGGSVSARYCYSAWLRHLVKLNEHTGRSHFPTIAELGPGDSLGIGIAAMLTGANNYYAFDIINFSDNARNLEILDELVSLFRNRQPIPSENEYSVIKPSLSSYEFPTQLLPDERIDSLLSPQRLAAIKFALKNINTPEQKSINIYYIAPWYNSDLIRRNSVDLIFSQAVMEHVDNVQFAYQKMREWLKTDGLMSHQIDFKSHGYTEKWNGHWGKSDIAWKILMGRKAYILNRVPHSTHIGIMSKCGFQIICDQTVINNTGIARLELAKRFRDICDEDLLISGAYIQASVCDF